MPETKSQKHLPRDPLPLQLDPREYKDFEAALRKFRKKVEKDGILRDYRAKLHFISKRQKKYQARQRAAWSRRKYGV